MQVSCKPAVSRAISWSSTQFAGISINGLHDLANDSATRNVDGQDLGWLLAEESKENVAVTSNSGEISRAPNTTQGDISLTYWE